jgi:hypothetical protein
MGAALNLNQAFSVVAGAWAMLAVGGLFAFYVNRNVAFKRKYFPWFHASGVVLFILLAIRAGMAPVMVAGMTPLVALVSYVHVRSTQFCRACGRTLVQQLPIPRATVCSQCGGVL